MKEDLEMTIEWKLSAVGLSTIACAVAVATACGSGAVQTGGTTDSDGGTVSSDGGSPSHDGGTTQSDGGITNSDGGTPNSDGATWYYDANNDCDAAPHGNAVMLACTKNLSVGSLAVDDAKVYFTDPLSSAVDAVPKGGGAVQVLFVSQAGARGIAVQANRLYWTAADSSGGYGIFAAPLGGGRPVEIHSPNPLTGEDDLQIAVDIRNVYAASPDGVWEIPLDGGTAKNVANGAFVHGVASDGTNVYWYTLDSVSSVPIGGGKVTTYAKLPTNSRAYISGLAVDGSSVYWTVFQPASQVGGNDLGTVMMARLDGDGGTPVTLAAKQTVPSHLAVDDEWVYWADDGISTLTTCDAGGVPCIASVYTPNSGDVSKVKKDGSGGPVVVSTGYSHPTELVQDALSLYWADGLIEDILPYRVWSVAK
jgi:hypothetical protein